MTNVIQLVRNGLKVLFFAILVTGLAACSDDDDGGSPPSSAQRKGKRVDESANDKDAAAESSDQTAVTDQSEAQKQEQAEQRQQEEEFKQKVDETREELNKEVASAPVTPQRVVEVPPVSERNEKTVGEKLEEGARDLGHDIKEGAAELEKKTGEVLEKGGQRLQERAQKTEQEIKREAAEEENERQQRERERARLQQQLKEQQSARESSKATKAQQADEESTQTRKAGELNRYIPEVQAGMYSTKDVRQLIRDALYDLAQTVILDDIVARGLYTRDQLDEIEVSLKFVNVESIPDALYESAVWDQRSRDHLNDFVEEGRGIPQFVTSVEPIASVSGMTELSSGDAVISLYFKTPRSRLSSLIRDEIAVSGIEFALRDARNILIANADQLQFPSTFQSVVIEFNGSNMTLVKDGYFKDEVLASPPQVDWTQAQMRRAAFYVDTTRSVNLSPSTAQVGLVSAYHPNDLASDARGDATLVVLRQLVNIDGGRRIATVQAELARMEKAYFRNREQYLDQIEGVVAKQREIVEQQRQSHLQEVNKVREDTYDQIVEKTRQRGQVVGKDLEARRRDILSQYEQQRRALDAERDKRLAVIEEEKKQAISNLKQDAKSEVNSAEERVKELEAEVEGKAQNKAQRLEKTLEQAQQLKPAGR